jgi:hypothetical protein
LRRVFALVELTDSFWERARAWRSESASYDVVVRAAEPTTVKVDREGALLPVPALLRPALLRPALLMPALLMPALLMPALLMPALLMPALLMPAPPLSSPPLSSLSSPPLSSPSALMRYVCSNCW